MVFFFRFFLMFFTIFYSNTLFAKDPLFQKILHDLKPTLELKTLYCFPNYHGKTKRLIQVPQIKHQEILVTQVVPLSQKIHLWMVQLQDQKKTVCFRGKEINWILTKKKIPLTKTLIFAYDICLPKGRTCPSLLKK